MYQNLDENKIITLLNERYKEFQEKNEKFTDWAKEKPSKLVDYIEGTHHAYLKEELPKISEFAFKILKVHGKSHEELFKVHKLVNTLRTELEEHLVKEEELLFPVIKEYEVEKNNHNKDWNFVEVKTGDTLDIGRNKLTFVEAKMLHWPDTMFTYLSGENILFSNDAFGQHYASELMYNDKVDQAELFQEAIKYYANILTPFSKFVVKKIEEVLSFNLPVNMICPSHGIIWRDNPLQIVNKYMEWAKDYQENQITIIYDTMWNCTRRMAEAIAEGIKSLNKNITIKIFNSSKSDKNDIITEVFKSRIVLVGSSTINKGILSSTAATLEMIKGLDFKGKKAVAFGSYGWSGESVKIIREELSKAGFEIINEGIRELWNPDEDGLNRCRDLGKNVLEKVE